MIAPPGRDAAAEHASLHSPDCGSARGTMSRMRTSSTSPGCGVLHRDRAGADMHAEAFAGAAAENRCVHRAGAATIDVLAVAGPAKHALGAGIARDHALGIVGGMLRQGLDGDGVARGDLDLRLQRAAEISPMHMRCLDRQMMVRGPVEPCVGCQFCGRRFSRRDRRRRTRCGRNCASASCGQPRCPARALGPGRRSASCWRNSRGGNPKR